MSKTNSVTTKKRAESTQIQMPFRKPRLPKTCSARHQSPEICVNLWCFMDEQTRLIYLLAGRVYALAGAEREKIALLQKLALTDYCVARTFSLPNRYSVQTLGEEITEGVIAPDRIKLIHAELFEHVFRGLESDLPVHFHTVPGDPQPHRLTIHENPLCITTCLVEHEDGRLEAKTPVLAGRQNHENPVEC